MKLSPQSRWAPWGLEGTVAEGLPVLTEPVHRPEPDGRAARDEIITGSQ